MESISPTPSSVVIETNAPIPHFLLKLWKLVDDKEYSQAIGWDKSGFSFHIPDPFVFSKETLPLYFKHNNINSFVRLLNMYGFRKVTSIDRSGIKSDGSEQLEFQHPYFIRGHPELLQFIKRKASHPRATGTNVEVVSDGVTGLNQILEEVRFLREQQGKMTAKLSQLEKNNTRLWHEVAFMRTEHVKQKTLVNKLLQFLASMVHPGERKRLGKRQLLMLADSVDPKKGRSASGEPSKINNKDPSSRPIIDDITDCSDSQDESGSSTSGNVLEGFGKDFGWINGQNANSPDPVVVASPPEFGFDSRLMGNSSCDDPLFSVMNSSSNSPAPIHPRQQDEFVQSPMLNANAVQQYTNFPQQPAEKSPQIDEHLDFVQSDLDYLKDLLNNGSFDIDLDSLNSLFEADSLTNFEQHADTITPPLNLMDSPNKNQEKTQIIGNEVSLHRVPEPIIDWQHFPDAAGMNRNSPFTDDSDYSHDPVISSAIVSSPSPPVLDEIVGFSPVAPTNTFPGEKRLLMPNGDGVFAGAVGPDSPLTTPPATPMNQPPLGTSTSINGGKKYQRRNPKTSCPTPFSQVSINPNERAKVAISSRPATAIQSASRPLITIVSPSNTPQFSKKPNP